MRIDEKCHFEIKSKYLKLLDYVRKLAEVEDYEYPFSLSDRNDIDRPSELLKLLGEE